MDINSKGVVVHDNDLDDFKLVIDDDIITYTESDEFVIMRNGAIMRTKGYAIQRDDVLVYNLD